jgi:hypothetical protein
VADLQIRSRWEPYAPKLDGNDQLERPFLFELACGLTRAEMRKLDDDMERHLRERTAAVVKSMPKPKKDEERAWQEKLADKLLVVEIDTVAEVLNPYVRMGPEPLTIAGKRITSLREYLDAVSVFSDQVSLMEPLTALRRANSLNGEQVLFSKRRSGGGSTTPDQSAAKKADRKEGR